MTSRALLACFFLTSLFAFAAGQELPDRIRGYKVYRAKIAVTAAATAPPGGSGALVRVGDPSLTDTSLNGLTFELPASIDRVDFGGRIDFLAFHDFKVNGLSVDIEEFREAFSVKKGEPVSLPRPITIFLNTKEAVRGAVREVKDSREEWDVTGRVFVFGRFRRYGMTFKRVVPVDVSVRIRNPLK